MFKSTSGSRHKIAAKLQHLSPHDVSNLVCHVRQTEVFAYPELRRKFAVRPSLVAETVQLFTAPFGHPE